MVIRLRVVITNHTYLDLKWYSSYYEQVKMIVAQSLSYSATPWTIACQAPLSMEFSRQEYWSGLPYPSPGDLLDSGIEPGSPALQVDSLPSEPPGKPNMEYYSAIKKKNEIMLFTATWMDLETIILNKVKSDRERQIIYDITYM